MKRFLVLLTLAASVFSSVPSAWAGDAARVNSADKSPSAPYATALSTVTGVAISPLLGTAGLGLWQYYRAETPTARAKLPWFAQLSFIIPALLLVGVVAAKDSLGASLPPGWKKPLDVLETVENKISGLVAAGAVVPFAMSSLSKLIVSSGTAGDTLLSSGTATVTVGAFDLSWLLNVLTIPIGIAVFTVVWLASHAINALILLSPWGAIDAILKLARTGLLALITLTAALNPWISAMLSLIVVLLAYLVAGWAFRLTIFGAIFSWDFLTWRKNRYRVTPTGANKLFSSNTLAPQGVPMRTYGQLEHQPENGQIIFRYRPWLVLPERTLSVKLTTPAVGQGLFISTLRDGDKTAFVLPPRYRGHELTFAQAYAIEGGVQAAGLLKAWGALRELFGGSAAHAQVS